MVYGYYVKRRVERYGQFDPVNNDGESERLDGGYHGEDNDKCKSVKFRFSTFYIYIVHLVVRLIILSVFVGLLFSAKFPIDYICSWHPKLKETASLNHTIPTSYDVILLACQNLNADKSKTLIQVVASVDVIFIILTILELSYLTIVAWKYRLFTTSREFCEVYLLRKRERFQTFLKKQKENFDSNEDVQTNEDFGDDQYTPLKFEEIYVNVIMQAERELKNAYPENYKRHEIFQSHLEIGHDARKLKMVTDIFKPIQGEKETSYPRSILVIGRPGIGKTMLTKKLMHEWKNNTDKYWRDKYVHLIRCRAFENVDITLQEMLCADGLPYRDYELIMSNPKKTVLIIDGLDELPLDDKNLKTDGPVLVKEKRPAFTVLSMLIKGKLLPGATVLITSRPTAEFAFKLLKFKRTVEILGFFEDQIKEYVHKFCGNDKESTELILSCIDNSIELRSLCYIPVNAYIVCLTLKECFTKEAEDIPKTTTELYKRAVKILLWKHHPDFIRRSRPIDYLVRGLPEELDKLEDLTKIKSLAKDGIAKESLIFNEPSLPNFPHLAKCGFFHKLPDRRRNLYCFIHLTLQEFFAAWCIVDDWQNIANFLDDNVSDSKWYLVIEFVAGLVGDMKRSGSIRNAETVEKVEQRFKKWISKLFLKNGDKVLGFLGVKCLYELQDKEVMRSACSELMHFSQEVKIDKVSFTPVDSNALFEFLSKCEHITSLSFDDCKFLDNHSCLPLKNYLSSERAEILINLKFRSCDLGNIFGENLSEALKSENCKLTKLDLGNNNIGYESAKYLRDALESESCKLTELDLSFYIIGDEGAKYFTEALKSENCKLTKLTLQRVRIGDKGAKYLSKALKSENCKLTTLGLGKNSIKDTGAKYLSEALKSENCKLTKLPLHCNNIGCTGAKYLSEALKSENCKLTELFLNENEIGDEGAKSLSEALESENCKLTELQLNRNQIGDKGARYLSKALKSDNCKLTSLNLSSNQIGDEGAKYLSETLKSDNCKLTQFYLDHNKLGDEGAKYLCEALKSDHCKLTEFYLKHNKIEGTGNNKIAATGVIFLGEAFKNKRCKLTEINILNNSMGDEGANHLSEALKSENCKLTDLSLNYNNIGNKGATSLSEALKSENCKLTELPLHFNNIDDEGSKSLSEALNTENCKLTKLSVNSNSIGVQGAKYLSSTLKSENFTSNK
ncbi:NLR family CARD domain-containing protein 3-like [Xenia sp. Carnegie-2017]|uniref:NLR family CARD domain-containing protein 3-like n=1 Tax=Xenia sp. Carnegie-2017 TaxID=2897299 RepID=UPI001F03E505|nr:NLR family CARD domain-containing protein 3-like [Xenia sp. Carnegie-2017]